MKTNLIVMLTNEDQTVPNAIEVFNSCKELPIEYWGFKNVGIPEESMCELISAIKAAGKKVFLEIVTYTEDSCMAGAKFAYEHKIDYLLGTIYYKSVWDYLKSKPIKYYPFVGEVYNNPSILKGNVKSMINQANKFDSYGISGADLLAYRYIDGDPNILAKEFVNSVHLNTIMAGSVNDIERIKTINDISPWGFTIGSALFTQKFVNGSFKSNLEEVLKIINQIDNQNK